MQGATHPTRIKSLHGIPIPPKDEETFSRYITLRLLIAGTLPSKKNRWYAATNFHAIQSVAKRAKSAGEAVKIVRDKIKGYIRNDSEYLEWQKMIMPVLVGQAESEVKKYEKFGVKLPLSNVSLKVYHYWVTNEARDLSNKLDTIQDLLVNAGIIKDDAWQHLRKIESSAGNYHKRLKQNLTTIDVTIRL